MLERYASEFGQAKRQCAVKVACLDCSSVISEGAAGD
jgi:hypothetical protein